MNTRWPGACERTVRRLSGRGDSFTVSVHRAGRPGLAADGEARDSPVDEGRDVERLAVAQHLHPLGAAEQHAQRRWPGDLDGAAGELLSYEWRGEIFYNYAITPSVQFTVDFQFIDPAIKTNDDVFVVGMRLFTQF